MSRHAVSSLPGGTNLITSRAKVLTPKHVWTQGREREEEKKSLHNLKSNNLFHGLKNPHKLRQTQMIVFN